MKSQKIKVFYTPKQVNLVIEKSYSKSPLKPKLVVEGIKSNDKLKEFFEFESEFKPYKKADFKIAHTRTYVDNFFEGVGNCSSNSIPWSENLAESVRYTNASLYNAIKHSINNPDTVCFSPTSGFHHAGPSGGSGFCTFSGQVIASVKMYRERGVRGAYLDLDGHFGNSIEDSRCYVEDLNDAVPVGFNFNPRGNDKSYLQDLSKKLDKLEEAIEEGFIDYIVWCHGADSHSSDDLHGQCNTEYWLECSRMFYSWLNRLEQKIGKSVPLTLALFGGYRQDDYQSVINLHLMDLGKCINALITDKFVLDLPIKEKQRYNTEWK